MEKLREAIVASFTKDDLKQLVKINWDKDLAAIVPDGVAYKDVVFNLIDRADQQGWIGELVLAVCDARPNRPDLQSFRSDQEVLAVKLSDLEKLYAKTLASSAESSYATELTLRSLRRTINQMKEEIARFEARTGSITEGE
jgi:hypothetical protein